MNKDEYIYLHALLHLIRSYLEEESNVSPGAFEEYDQLPIEAPQIYKAKAKHKEAITILGSELDEVVDAKEREHPVSRR